MFTGLIEAICTVKTIRPAGDSMVLSIDLGKLVDEAKTGDSIAINGACLTITQIQVCKSAVRHNAKLRKKPCS